MSRPVASELSTDKVLMISSDGHATARMEGYRPYIPSGHLEEFDAFCAFYGEVGSRYRRAASGENEPDTGSKITNRDVLETFFDRDVVEMWIENIAAPGRLEGSWDVKKRFEEMARAGVAAEVIFPDFGRPFEVTEFFASLHGYRQTSVQKNIADGAYNRWLVDFCSAAPHRFAGMATVSFEDVDAAIAEIRWAKEAGLKGVLLPMFSDELPIFHPRFEPIWSVLEELRMPVNAHSSLSGTSDHLPVISAIPHRSVFAPIMSMPTFFLCHQLLNHLIFGGVLERHPDLQVVFTEVGSGWVIGTLEGMDYTWDGSYLRRDVREVVKLRPSEYFRRQCHLGSSLFSRAEIEARDEIGLHQMTLGMDYPHPEGTWGMGPGHIPYLQATLGAAHVPQDEVRLLVGENAVKLWGFDRTALQPVVDSIGPSIKEILKEPEKDCFPRGDVHKPLALANRN